MNSSKLNTPTLLTISQASRRFDISEYCLRQLLKRADCPVKFVRTKENGKHLVNADTLAAWLNGGGGGDGE
jgi:hypothetical protein